MTCTASINQMNRFTSIAALLLTAIPAAASTQVKDALKTADMNFRVGNEDIGCTMVDTAIMAANNPDIYGTNTVSRSEIASSARRYNLRF